MRLITERTNLLNSYKGFYKNYNANVDQDVFEKLLTIYKDDSPQAYLSESLKSAKISELSKKYLFQL